MRADEGDADFFLNSDLNPSEDVGGVDADADSGVCSADRSLALEALCRSGIVGRVGWGDES